MPLRGLSGYGVLTHPDGPTRERDTFTCGHCNSIRHAEPFGRGFLVPVDEGVKFRSHEYTRCGQCDTLICEKCTGKGCLPFEKKLEQFERAAALYKRVMERS